MKTHEEFKKTCLEAKEDFTIKEKRASEHYDMMVSAQEEYRLNNLEAKMANRYLSNVLTLSVIEALYDRNKDLLSYGDRFHYIMREEPGGFNVILTIDGFKEDMPETIKEEFEEVAESAIKNCLGDDIQCLVTWRL